MKLKWTAFVLIFSLLFTLVSCGGEESTLTGMVVSVEGSVISLREMDAQNRENFEGQRPNMFGGGEMPEGFDPENFDPENFDFSQLDPEQFGSMPEGFERPTGESMPQFPMNGGKFERPADGQMPEGFERPTNGEMPEGFERPTDGKMPDFGNFQGETGEEKSIDLANAHISVEIDGGKASGSLEDIKVGTFVTVTLDSKGNATNVLVSSRTGMRGGNANGES